MNPTLRKILRAISYICIVIGILSLTMQAIAISRQGYGHLSGGFVWLVMGVSLWLASIPSKKERDAKKVAPQECEPSEEKRSFAGFVALIFRIYQQRVDPMLYKVLTNIDWPLELHEKLYFQNHKFLGLIVLVIVGLLWCCAIPYIAVSLLLAIIPSILIVGVLYLFGMSADTITNNCFWIIGPFMVLGASFVVITIISY